MDDVDHLGTEQYDAVAPPGIHPPITARHRWILLGAATWLITGLQLDAWAHANVPQLETFWTPWHAVLYTGIAACGFTLAWLVRLSLPGTRLAVRTVAALPLRPLLAGMALLLVGGGIDTVWHNVFGIEKGLEIFASPSHIMIILGMVLVASGPTRLLWIAPGSTLLRPLDALLVLASTLLAVVPLHIFALHATVLVRPQLGSGLDPMPVHGVDALALHGYLTSTVLLLAPLVVLGRRWRLPYGVGPVLVGLPALLMWTAFSGFGASWYPLSLAGAAALAEVALRAGERWVAVLRVDAAWVLLGAVAPLIVWGAILLIGARKADYGWDVHTTTGLLALTGLFGAATAFVTRRVQV